MPIVVVETLVLAPIEQCFDAARDIPLHTKTVWPHTREEAIGGIVSGKINLGETVTFRATHFGIRQNLTSKIVEFARPYRFVDEMQKGAFQRLRHTHEFISQGEATLMRDTLTFNSPFGMIGFIFDRLVLQHYMRKFIYDRNERLKIFLEEGV